MRFLLHNLTQRNLISLLVKRTRELKYLLRFIWYNLLDNAFWVWCIAVSMSMAYILFNYWDLIFVVGEPDIGATIRNVAIVWGGLVGIGLAAWRSKIAERQAEVSRSQLLDERYQNAVELLTHKNVHIRIGAIHAVRNLAISDPMAFGATVGTILKTMKDSKDLSPILPEQEVTKEKDMEDLILEQAILDVQLYAEGIVGSHNVLYDRAIRSMEIRARRTGKNRLRIRQKLE